MISSDKALCKLLRMKKVPVADSISKWLKQSTQKKVEGMEKISRDVLLIDGKNIATEYSTESG